MNTRLPCCLPSWFSIRDESVVASLPEAPSSSSYVSA